MGELKDIDEQKLEAFQHALTQSLVGIVGKDNSGEFGKSVGTGTFIEVSGEKYILTAAHVINNCTTDELRYFLPFEGVGISEVPTTPRAEQLTMREHLRIESVRSDDDLDVAVLKIDPSVTIRKFWSFRKLRRVIFPPAPKFQFMMMGFPAQRARVVAGDNLMVFPNVDYVELVNEKSLKGFDPKIHFVTDFPSAAKFHPGGYSGSGLWGDEISEGEAIWKPHPIFLGLELAYFTRKRLLQILSVNAIVDFIEGKKTAGK